MKKFFLNVICLLVFFMFALQGCADKQLDKSENVESVIAYYYLSDTELADPLLKSAELPYTKINILPKKNTEVSSLSFDAKLKTEAKKTLKIKVYALNNNDNTTVTNITIDKFLLASKVITLTDNMQSFSVDLSEVRSFNVAKEEEKITSKEFISIEFYHMDDEKNSNTIFSVNNIILLKSE